MKEEARRQGKLLIGSRSRVVQSLTASPFIFQNRERDYERISFMTVMKSFPYMVLLVHFKSDRYMVFQ
jgi:hypothetical protein